MTTALAIDIEQTTVYAEDLPEHEAQLILYTSAGLTSPEAFGLESRAARIISAGRRTIVEIGQELLAARQEARYGTWNTFLARCGIEERTAQNYMHVVERFGDKPEIISALPPTALYAMAAPTADQAIVGEIVEEVRSGAPPPTVQEVKQRLSPAPLPMMPTDLADQGWSIRKYPSGEGYYELVNSRHGAATPPLPLEEVFDHARRVEAKLSQPPAAPADTDEEEIATAPAPGLPPALAPHLPPALPGMSPLKAVAAGLEEQRLKLLAAKYHLLRESLNLIEAEIRALPDSAPIVSVPEASVQDAARLFVNGQALGGAAAMLAFSATVEEVVT
jgi:hypothetical protein